MYHTYSVLSSFPASERCHLRQTAILYVFITISFLISIFISPFMQSSHVLAADISISDVFYSDTIQTKQTLTSSHDILTNAARIRQNILYTDTINKASLNYYFINNPSTGYTLYINCNKKDISPDSIQFFDDTNKEIKINISSSKKYIYADLKKIISKSPETTCVYIAIASKSSHKSNIKIICTKTKTAKKNKPAAVKINIKPTAKTPVKDSTPKKQKTSAATRTPKPAHQHSTTTHHSISANKLTKKYKTTHHKTTDKNKKNNTNNHLNTTGKNKKNNTNNHLNTTGKNKKNNTNNHLNTTGKNKKNNTNNYLNTAGKNKKIAQKYFFNFSSRFITIKKGEHKKLNFATNINLTKNTKVIWSVSSTKIVTVHDQTISAHNNGIAIIRLTLKNNSLCKSTSCTVRVIT